MYVDKKAKILLGISYFITYIRIQPCVKRENKLCNENINIFISLFNYNFLYNKFINFNNNYYLKNYTLIFYCLKMYNYFILLNI